MMVFTTLFMAAIVIAALYFIAVRYIKWPVVSYALMVVVGFACLFGGVHFAYIGIEVAVLGSLTVWLHYRYWRKPPLRPAQ